MISDAMKLIIDKNPNFDSVDLIKYEDQILNSNFCHRSMYPLKRTVFIDYSSLIWKYTDSYTIETVLSQNDSVLSIADRIQFISTTLTVENLYNLIREEYKPEIIWNLEDNSQELIFSDDSNMMIYGELYIP